MAENVPPTATTGAASTDAMIAKYSAMMDKSLAAQMAITEKGVQVQTSMAAVQEYGKTAPKA